jgi:glycosyltransferase involved in cell wall biosynthesis
MPLRVLQIVPSVSLVYGGPSQMVRGFSQALADAGAEVTMLTTDANGDVGQAPLEVPLNQPVREANYTVRYFRCAPFRRYKFSSGLLRWLWHNARNYDIAHIHALFSPLSTAAATIARWQKLPYIMRPLGTLDPADLRKKLLLKQLYGNLWEKPNLRGAAAVHFTSAMEAEVSHRFGAATRDLLIPLGVDPSPDLAPAEQQVILQSFNIPTDKPIVLYLSRLDPKKGFDLLLPALERLSHQGIPFHFVLAGGNPQNPAYERSIADQIERTVLKHHTTRTGFVQGQAKTALLQAADLFVLPSYYENFGIAVAEAMMAALPVVISKGVYIWQAVAEGDAGWVCNDLTVASLTDALAEALTDPVERQLKGQRAKAYAETHYRWAAIAQQTLVAYHTILEFSNPALKQSDL